VPLLRLLPVALFFLSGATGLVYEVVWMRWLALGFGVTVQATATVLATFMAGLALGSWALGRWVDGRRRPLLVYAALEAGIGLYALAAPALFEQVQPAYVALHRLGLPAPLFAFGRAALLGAVLLPPTILMGGTLPALARYFVARREGLGAHVGLLYFVNTAGAVAGCLLAGFLLIERLGLDGTTLVAASGNAGIALVAGAIGLRARPLPGHAGRAAPRPRPDAAGTPAHVRLALAAITLSGFASLGYEVLWTRALTRYLYNSTYAFTTMLATFLTGLALGSAVYGARWSRTATPLRLFALLELGVGAGFLVSYAIFPDLMTVSAAVVPDPVLRSFGDSVVVMFVRAALVLAVPTFLLGATLPLATAVCTESLERVGQGVGRVYAWNTAGAIAGSLGAAFVLIPGLGMQGTLVALATLNFALAGALGVASASARAPRFATAAGVALAWLVALALLPPQVFRRTFAPASGKLVFYREGVTDTAGVFEAGSGRHRHRILLFADQRGTAGTHSASWNFFLGHLPVLIHPGTPRRALHICLGAGNSLNALASEPSIERIDSVELSETARDAAPYFWTNDGVLADPKVHHHVDDGRTFLMSARTKWDVIVLEPPEVFTAGVINLYTREFYREAAARLADDGLFAQWLLVGQASLEDERMVLRAFYDVFPWATAWKQPREAALLLVGSKQPWAIDYQRLRARFARGRVAQDLSLTPIRDVDELLGYLVFDPPAFADFVRGATPVTDDRTVLDFDVPRMAGAGFGFGLMQWGHGQPLAIDPAHALAERMRFYLAQRRAVVPFLTDLGPADPAAVEARIDAARARRLGPLRLPTEEEWHALRADPSLRWNEGQQSAAR
jgi:spermidine synthase